MVLKELTLSAYKFQKSRFKSTEMWLRVLRLRKKPSDQGRIKEETFI